MKPENASLEYGLVSRLHDYFSRQKNHPQKKLGASKFTILIFAINSIACDFLHLLVLKSWTFCFRISISHRFPLRPGRCSVDVDGVDQDMLPYTSNCRRKKTSPWLQFRIVWSFEGSWYVLFFGMIGVSYLKVAYCRF